LSDYTDGASEFASGLADDFRAGRIARGSPVEEAARRFAALKEDRKLEWQVIDYRRLGGKRCSLTVRFLVAGTAATGERVDADLRFGFVLEKGAGKWRLVEARSAQGGRPFRTGIPHLSEVSREIGLGAALHEPIDPVEMTNYCIPATHHHPGVLVVDFDGDGAPDVLLPNRRPQLFLNDGHGLFHEATVGSGLDLLAPGEAAGGVAADLDGDGLPELFLTYAYSPCRLLHNEGHGRFRDITEESGLAALSGPYTSAVFFDADGDGRLDLFIANYGDARVAGPAYFAKNAPGNRFFHNVERSGRPFFVDETAAAGFGDRGWGLAASACDYDGDGRDDLYVANDFGTNCLYHNRSTPGHPRFDQIAKQAGVLDDGYGMGVTWGDVDGDGLFDLHVADFSTPYHWLIRGNRMPMPPVPISALARPFIRGLLIRRSRGDGLYRNLGGGRFERISESAGVAEGGWAWGTELVDMDGDGREDLLVVNGMWEAAPDGHDDEVALWNGMGAEGIHFHDGSWGGIDFGSNGMASRTPKHLFRNLGGGRFEDVAFREGFDTRANARGLAYADLDGDGAPDIVISTFRGPLLVYRNGWKASRLTLALRGAQPHNRDAIGAVVRLTSGGALQIREVRAGSSFLSQSSRDLLFGLGAATGADSIEVAWPDGRRQTRRNVPAGARVIWDEGSGS
jgi:hypothetical protein